MGPALRAKADCALSEVHARRDGDWVTIGGMITQAKRIRTKKGDPMMFATLDDLERCGRDHSCSARRSQGNEAAVENDSIVLIRGRVDHKDRDKTCVIVQQVERFDPTPEEVQHAEIQEAKVTVPPSALRLRLEPSALPATILGELKDLLANFPGECDVVIELPCTGGERRLRLGPEFRVARSAGLHAELEALLGEAIIRPRALAEADDAERVAASDLDADPGPEAIPDHAGEPVVASMRG